MNKRKEESETKKLKDNNNLSKAREFINSVEYLKADSDEFGESEFWHYQIHNRMRFNQLMVGIIAEREINDEDLTLFKELNILNVEQTSRLEETRRIDEDIFNTLQISGDVCNDDLHELSFKLSPDPSLMSHLTEEFRSRVTDVDFIVYPDEGDNPHEKYCPVKPLSIKDISITSALIRESTDHAALYEESLTAASTKININDKINADSCHQKSLKLEDIGNYVGDSMLENNITKNGSKLDDSIDDIVNKVTSAEDPKYAFIRIDMSCPRVQLKAYLMQLLKDQGHDELKIIKNNLSKEMGLWYSKRVLQIWDLNMWCIINDVDLNHKDYINIIFPEYEFTLSENNFTKRNYNYTFKKVFSWANFNQLKSYIHRKG